MGESVVTFDGTVVEFFGFLSYESHRFHVANLDEIEIADRHLIGTAINVRSRPSSSWQCMPNFKDGQRPEFEQLIAEVHTARDAWSR